MCSSAIWDLSPPLPPASFRSGCRTAVILCLRVYLVFVFLLYHHRFRSPHFVKATEPWRYRTFWVHSACTPLLAPLIRPLPFVQPAESWWYCDSSCVCALLKPTKELVIVRLRVSLCCILGSILSCIFGFYSDLPPPVPLVPSS